MEKYSNYMIPVGDWRKKCSYELTDSIPISDSYSSIILDII